MLEAAAGRARAGPGQRTYPQSPERAHGGWQLGSACVPRTHRHSEAVGDRQATRDGLWSLGFYLPFPYPLPALGLTSVVNSSTSFMDSSLPANRARAACCSASRC